MTFEEAMERLPECSWAVNRDGRYVQVWALYYQNAEEVWDPEAEDGPRLQMEGLAVIDGEFAPSGVGDWRKAEDADAEIRGLDWKATDAKKEEFSSAPNPAARVHVLKGMPLEEATEADEWPEEVQEIAENVEENVGPPIY